MKEKLLEIIQGKANKASAMINKALEVSESLGPRNVGVTMDAIPCRVNEDGSFLVLTGTKSKPYGIGLKDRPDLVLLYNEKGGVFVDTSMIIDLIKANRESLTPKIDDTYSVMGVSLNIGLISSVYGEDFLTALHQSSLHDS